MYYEKLSKYFYKNGSVAHQQEYEKRINDYGAYQTNLTIQPFRKGKTLRNEEKLFFVNIHPLVQLYEEVLMNSSAIQVAVSKLPSFAVEPYFHKLIVNEAQSNNEIEGVRSTKEELSNVLEHLHDCKQVAKKRFLGMMKMYRHIDQVPPFRKIEDFRMLYDDLVAEEIVKNKQPDGEYFRAKSVSITDGSKITHRGLEPETKIMEKLHDVIHFLNDDEIPDLYKYMIAHYYYEYIHPFYDGNGRTGRLFVCSYVSRKLERYSAITLSYAINNDKPKYHKALENIADPFNKGDMTFYLIDMLELLSAGQKALLEDLQIVLTKSERIKQYIEKIDWTDNKDVKAVLRIQLDIAALSQRPQSLSNAELVKILNLSSHKITKIMEELEQKGIVTLMKRRPKTYKIQDEFTDRVFE